METVIYLFNTFRDVIASLFLFGSLLFFAGSAIGMLRLPDFYSRIHASGNSETMGITLGFIGLMIHEGATLTTLKMAFVFLLLFIGNPIGSHILAKAVYKTGTPVWTLESKDADKILGKQPAKNDHAQDEPVNNKKTKEEDA
ncbi:MAG: monovalent cation/H(+) antiporter subunit G [Phascolarctobacterium sp.]|nr:monovalent cation/H(+) antiporter subunit G [Phascolarctobacterium sp.]